MTNLPAGRYIAIETGTTRSAALDHDGSIRWGGQAWTGSILPEGNGYTDITLGPDYGIAIREAAEEVILSGPISPGKPLEGRKRGSSSTDTPTIPIGSTIEHSDHDVTRIYGPDGTQLGWVNDKEAQKIPVSDTLEIPVSSVFSIPSEAYVNQSSPQTIVVDNRTGLAPEISVKSYNPMGSPSRSMTTGIYYQNYGGTVASVVVDDVFIAPLIQTSNTRSITDLTYKYMRRDYDGGRDINIYCEGSGDDATCEGQVSNADDSLKRSGSPATQPLNFTVVPADTTGNKPLTVSAETIASKDGSTLHYTITATSSQTLPQIKITPLIYSNSLEDYTLMNRDPDRICYDANSCTISGDYTVTGTGNYLASGYVDLTVPAGMSDNGLPRNFNLLPDSRTTQFEQTSDKRNEPSAPVVPILQIDNKDIYLWGIASERRDETDPGGYGAVNIVIYNLQRDQLVQKITLPSLFTWTLTGGSAENGLSGKSMSTLTWKIVPFGTSNHLSKGGFLAQAKDGGRIHCPIFEAGYSSSLQNNWIFLTCHKEYWVWGRSPLDDSWVKPTHVTETNYGENLGRESLKDDLIRLSIVEPTYSKIYFGYDDGYADGRAYILTAK